MTTKAITRDAGPTISYDPSLVPRVRPYKAQCEGFLRGAVSLAGAHGLQIERVKVYHFRSVEDPSYEEYVFSFYSRSTDDLLVEFFETLAEYRGAWLEDLPEAARKRFGDKVSIELKPLASWKDAQP